MSGGFHSDDYVDAVLDLWATGEGASEIAEQLGDPLTEMRVKRLVARMRRNGDPRAGSRPKKTTWTAERRTQVADLIEAGLTVRGIAAEMGCSASQVIGYISRNGLRLARPANKGNGKPKAEKPARKPGFDVGFKRRAFVQPKSVNLDGAKPIRAIFVEKKQVGATLACANAIEQLGEKSCRFPIGDPRSVEFHFCNAESVVGKPYCADHCRLAYTVRSEAA